MSCDTLSPIQLCSQTDFVESIIGGEDTLEFLLRLGVVFLSRDGVDENEWVVPLVHLFSLDVPSIKHCDRVSNNESWRKNMVLMTDLHPNVLGMTPSQK